MCIRILQPKSSTVINKKAIWGGGWQAITRTLVTDRSGQFHTSVADNSDWGWGEEENSGLEKCKLPQSEDVQPKELQELGEAAGRVGDLKEQRQWCKSQNITAYSDSPLRELCIISWSWLYHEPFSIPTHCEWLGRKEMHQPRHCDLNQQLSVSTSNRFDWIAC